MPSSATQTKPRSYSLKTAVPLKQVPEVKNWLITNVGKSPNNWKMEAHNGSLFNWRGIAGAIKSNNIEADLPVTVIVTIFSPIHVMLFLQSWDAELLLDDQAYAIIMYKYTCYTKVTLNQA